MSHQPEKNRERRSADAYLNFLQRKGADSHALYVRSRFLDTLIPELAGKELSRSTFADAMEKIQQTINKDDLSVAISTSREYFAFWMSDAEGVHTLEKNYGVNTKKTVWNPKPKTAKTIESGIKANIFTDEETASISNYKIHLLKTVSDARLVDEWLHYAKILLIRLRDAPYKDHEIYRTAIDLTITLFKDKSSQKNYLNAARKFYKFWRAKPKGYL